MNEDFYVGYFPRMPSRLTRPVRLFIAIAVLAAISLTIAFWLAQKPFATSFFEFGDVKEYSGTIQSGAVPFLLVENVPGANGLPRFERFPLVGEGKHGFVADGLDGRRVKLRGTLIYRDDLRMIEVADESSETDSGVGATDGDVPEPLGAFTLRGEIVDSKCYLGVMNPGSSKPHRDCAVACLRGGVPALFIVRDDDGNKTELWLVSATGERVNRSILDFVAEPVEITGEVTRRGDQLFFAIDPARITRLP